MAVAHGSRSTVVSQSDQRPRRVVQPERVARALRHPVRRATLATVLSRDGPVPVANLVTEVDEWGDRYGLSADRDRASLRQAIHHRHLPVLVTSGLLARQPGGLVTTGDHRFLSHPAVTPAWLRQEGADWAALGAVFGQPRRRIAVSVLATVRLPLGLAPLARAVAVERRSDIMGDAPLVEDLQCRLHHVGLPMLDDAGVLRYDSGERRVTHLSTPDLPLPVDGV